MFKRKKPFIGIEIGVYRSRECKMRREKKNFEVIYLPSTDYATSTIIPNGDFRAFRDGRTVFFCPKESLAYVRWREHG